MKIEEKIVVGNVSYVSLQKCLDLLFGEEVSFFLYREPNGEGKFETYLGIEVER